MGWELPLPQPPERLVTTPLVGTSEEAQFSGGGTAYHLAGGRGDVYFQRSQRGKDEGRLSMRGELLNHVTSYTDTTHTVTPFKPEKIQEAMGPGAAW